MPGLSIEQPLNVATPAVTVLLLPPVQVSVPGPPLVGVPAAIESVTTVELSDATVLPAASSTRTVGWTLKGVPPVFGEGGVVGQARDGPQQSASLPAVPEEITNDGPVAGVRAGAEVALSV